MANEIPAGRDDLDTQWEKLLDTSRVLRARIPSAQSTLSGGAIDKAAIFSIVATMNKALEKLQELVDLPAAVRSDLQDYARVRKRDDTFDLAAGGLALRAAVIAVNDYVETAFPTDGSGYLLAEQTSRGDTATGTLHIVPRILNNQTALDNLNGLLQAVFDLTAA